MATLVTVILSVCVTACGGSGDSTSAADSIATSASKVGPASEEPGSTTSAPPRAVASRIGAPGGGASTGGAESQGSVDHEGSVASKQGRGARPASSEAADPSTPGFEDTSGQTDIPAFGIEADSGERQAVEAVVNAYLRAAEAEEWTTACTYLDQGISGELSKFAKGSDSDRDAGCATALPQVLSLSSRYQDLYLGAAPLSGLRIKEGAGAGFALFHGDDGNDYWIAVKVESGRWKILSTTPTRLAT